MRAKPSDKTMDPAIWSALPLFLQLHVLSWLPLASLARAAIVCKTWKSEIYSGQILSLVSAQEPWFIFFRSVPGAAQAAALISSQSPKKWAAFSFSNLAGYGEVLDSHNGLVCVGTTRSATNWQLAVLNPLTGSSKFLPKAPSCRLDFSACIVALHVDKNPKSSSGRSCSKRLRYKVVVISYWELPKEHCECKSLDCDCPDTTFVADVYDSDVESWSRRSGTNSKCSDGGMICEGNLQNATKTVHNGVVHFVTIRGHYDSYPHSILSYNILADTWHEAAFRGDVVDYVVDDYYTQVHELGVDREGALILIHGQFVGKNLVIYRKIGSKGLKWNAVVSVPKEHISSVVKMIGYSRNGDVVIFASAEARKKSRSIEKEILVCNLDEGWWDWETAKAPPCLTGSFLDHPGILYEPCFHVSP